MKIEELLSILNNGSQADLVKIPGIGNVLAERIMDSRPFDTLESVENVRGLSEAMFAQWLAVDSDEKPKVQEPEISKEEENEQAKVNETADTETEGRDFSDSAREGLNRVGEVLRDRTKTAREAIQEGLSNVGETVKEQTINLSDLPERLEKVSKERGPIWTMMVASAVTIFVSVFLLLLILAGINGSLKFATSSEYRVLQQESAQNSSRLDTMQQDLVGLRDRINTLEGLGERMVVLEKTQGQVSEELKSMKEQLSAMQTEMDALNKKVALQDERTTRFETFLKSLQTLLGSLFAPQGESK